MSTKKKNDSSKRDQLYVKHIADSIYAIESYIKGVKKTSFAGDTKTQDAIIRRIEIIGEAAKRISLSMKKQYPDIPWREMAGMRDKLIHHYDDIELPILWDTLKEDIPTLKKLLSPIKE